MRFSAGYSQVNDPDGKRGIIEQDFFKCCHCGGYHFVEPKDVINLNRCPNCDDYRGGGFVCDSPECHRTCKHFMRKIEEAEARERFRSMI